MSHRDKLYEKYRNSEEVEEKDPQYEETERISSAGTEHLLIFPKVDCSQQMPSVTNLFAKEKKPEAADDNRK